MSRIYGEIQTETVQNLHDGGRASIQVQHRCPQLPQHRCGEVSYICPYFYSNVKTVTQNSQVLSHR